MSWNDGTPIGIDLYYDPVVDEHVGHGPMGLIAPAWYLAPQRRDVAQAAWELGAALVGALGDGEIVGVDDPFAGVMLAQLAGELADPATKARIWDAADEHFEPTWDRDLGEFTLGFGLGEEHPRGQLNARAMAGWVCEQGDWSRIFDEPADGRFDEPTVTDVDFPRVALSRAAWDGHGLDVSAHPQNAAVRDTTTTIEVSGLPPGDWAVRHPDGTTAPVARRGDAAVVELTVDDRPARVEPA